MAQKQAKNIRRQIRREAAKHKIAIINNFLTQAKTYSLRDRLHIALRLAFKKEVRVTSKPR